MTQEQFDRLPFRFVSHMSAEDHHSIVYHNAEYNILVYKVTPYKDGQPTRGGYTHYKYNGKVYKSKKSLLRVMELVEMLK